MTTFASATTSSATASTPSRTPLMAVLGVALSAVFTAIGTFWDLTNNDPSVDDHAGRAYLVTVGIIVVLAALVYGLVVRGAMSGRPGRRSAILGLVAAASIPVFWVGAPVVFASAAIATALAERDKLGSLGNASKAGIGLAALTTMGALVLAITG